MIDTWEVFRNKSVNIRIFVIHGKMRGKWSGSRTLNIHELNCWLIVDD
jgi:hypothetical protein